MISLIESRECEVCREALFIIRETQPGVEDRTFALDQKDKQRHVCFELPQDANLLVLEDPE